MRVHRNSPIPFTDQKVDFRAFRRGWCVPPGLWTSHYMMRRDLTHDAISLCGTVLRYIPLDDSVGFHSLWHEGSFKRCKTCQRLAGRYNVAQTNPGSSSS